MQFVPSLPPPITLPGPEEALGVNKLSEVKRVKNVLEQSASAPTFKLHAQHEPLPDLNSLAETPEKRHAEAGKEERRILCRRIKHDSILDELRSEIDRRHNKQRQNDISDHIDEEA